MKNNKQAGFTVVELLVAIAIFAIVIPSLILGVQSLVTLNNRARDLAVVNVVVSNKAEQIRSSGFNSLAAGTFDFTSELPAEVPGPKSANYVVTIPSAGIAEVTLNVSYKDYSRTRTLTYKTIVSELGVGQ